MKGIRRLLAAVVSTAMVFSCFTLPSLASEADASVSTWSELRDAVAAAPVNDISWTYITLDADIETEDVITISEGKEIEIVFNGHKLSRKNSGGKVIYVAPGAYCSLYGYVEGGGSEIFGGCSSYGGAIRNDGTLEIFDIGIRDNSTVDVDSEANRGGAIYNTGDLRIIDCHIYGNTASDGGAIYNTGSIEFMGATISGNFSKYHGGGGIVNNGSLIFWGSGDRNVISGNTSKSDGGGIWNNGTIEVGDTLIIKENTSTSFGSNNLYLKQDKKVKIMMTGLSADSEIWLSCEGSGYLTEGYAQEIDEGKFKFENGIQPFIYNGELANGVTYISRSWDASQKKVIENTELLGAATKITQAAVVSNDVVNLSSGWYLVDVDTLWENRVVINGTVNLVLMDGKIFRVNKGIAVNSGATLNIYGQSGNSGSILAYSDSYNSPIGSDDQDTDSGKYGGGTINIYGGKIDAVATSDAAGIGGGNEAGNGAITIYGGKVTAYGGGDAAGIGTGDEPQTEPGDITIYGGTVNAFGGAYGAGIGGGDAGKGGRIYIYGGTIEEARGGDYGAGIGGGEESVANCIQIDGGTVNAFGGKQAAGIGTGYNACNNNGKLENIVINGGVVNATSGYYGAAIGTGSEENFTSGNITINGGIVTACAQYSDGAGIGTGMSSHCGLNITINGGTVTALDHKYASDADDTGAAGIGAGANGNLTGKITITGGEVHAAGAGGCQNGSYYGGAGIGAGYQGNVTSGAEIKITGGTVDAQGKNGGAAIGAGAEISMTGIGGECEGTITITGGTVKLSLSSNGNAVFCGHGNAGDYNGTLTVADSLKVYRQNSAPVASSQRAATCQSSNSGVLFIDECRHLNKTYTFTESGHTAHCPNCNTSFPEEPHTYNDNATCTVCGQRGDIWVVNFNAGGGSGSKDNVLVVTGNDYTLPECTFTAPEGKTFKEWSVVIGTSAAVTKAPGETITVTANTTVTAVWEYAAPTFIGYAMRLDGKITLQYIVGLPDDMMPGECYVTFEGKNVDSNEQYPLSTEKSPKANGYVVELDISSIEMAEQFTPTLHYTLAQGGNESTVTGNAYSAKEYIDHGITHFSGNDLTIVKALANYGHYSQPYLSAQNNWGIGTDYAEMTTKSSTSFDHDAIKNATSSYAAVRTTSDDITAVTYKVRFGSEISIAVFLTPRDGVTIEKVTVDDKEVTPTRSGNRYYVIISNISVTKLTESHTISYGTASITVSPMSYVNGILSSGTTSDAAKDLVCALYNLAEACK
ncbi:MAG: hypothetical protein J5379_04930 [Clostridiales bacterium]|nr:hypothetical protein [Clostridiales bacterium]